MAPKWALAGSVALSLGAGCYRSHAGYDNAGARPAASPTTDRRSCVSHWAWSQVGHPLALFENGALGPAAPLELMRSSAGELGWLVHTRTDVTGDGTRDLLVRNRSGEPEASCSPVVVTVYEVSSDAPTSWQQESVTGPDCRSETSLDGLGDWNGDGIDDFGAEGAVFVRGADGALVKDSHRCERGSLLGDVDGDGSHDSGCNNDHEWSDSGLIVWGGRNAEPTMLELPCKDGFTAAGDVNGDGFDDFVAHDPDAGHRMVLGNSRRELDPIRLGYSAATIFTAVDDLDDDGFDDLLLVGPAQVYLLRGARNFMPDDAVSFAALAGVPDVIRAAGDANCDGFADVLIWGEGQTALHLGSRAGVELKPAWTSDLALLVPVFGAGR